MKAQPLGYVTLLVTLGHPKNFRTEKVAFKVVDFEMAYNVVLGRPTLAKFMCVPHNTYQLLKKLGPDGIITILGDPKLGVLCNKRSQELDRKMAALEAGSAAHLLGGKLAKSKPKISV